MPAKIALDSLLAVAKRSSLLTAEQLKVHRDAFVESGGDANDARNFADFLVKQQVLTRWQADKLLQGKHKGFFLGKYKLLSLLGKGGMSSVYLAEHVLMRRRCAIKVLPTKRVHDTSYLGRFHREAQAVAALDDPNIVRAYDVDHQIDGDMEIHFLVMEFVDGRSLLVLVQEDGLQSPVDTADFIRQGALGLAHAHQAGLVHRDIKPGNLLVDSTGTVKLLDLGLARFFAGSEDVALTIEHDEKVLGTADYLAPEQAVDSHLVDARADIYSLGCTMYFLLTGHPPFTQGTLTQRLLAHQTKVPSGVENERSDVPDSLLVILKRMMAKQADDRYPDCEAVAAELASWLRANGGADRVSGSDTGSGSQQTGDAPGSDTDAAVDTAASEPPETVDTEVDPDREPELGAFLAQLGSAEGSVEPTVKPTKAPADTPRPPAGKTATDPSRVRGTTQQGRRKETALSSVNAETILQAEPVDEALPVAEAIHQTPTIVTAAPEPTEAATSPVEHTFDSEADGVAIAESVSATQTNRRRKGQRNGVLTGVAIAGVVALVAGIGYVVSQNGSGPGDDPAPPPEEFHSADGGPETGAPLYPDDLGPEIRVGTEEVFPTISDAIAYVEEHADRFGPENPWIILVEGGAVFDERLVIRGSAFGGFPDGSRIASDGAPAVLRPQSGEGPVIDLDHTTDVAIDGFLVDAGGGEVAIRLSNDLLGTRLERLEVMNFSNAGVVSVDGQGLRGRPVHLNELTLRAEDQDAVGIRLNDMWEAEITGCRFVGPMAAGLEFVTSARTAYVTIRRCRFHELQTGVLLRGGQSELQSIALINNTFHRVQRGIVLFDMPQLGSSGFVFKHNLFSRITGAEVVVERRYIADHATELLAPADAVNNWSERSGDDVAEEELDIFATGGRRGIDEVPFASTSPDTIDFLRPTDRTLRTDVGPPAADAADYVGAVPP